MKSWCGLVLSVVLMLLAGCGPVITREFLNVDHTTSNPPGYTFYRYHYSYDAWTVPELYYYPDHRWRPWYYMLPPRYTPPPGYWGTYRCHRVGRCPHPTNPCGTDC
jgi:hypothetical protein